MADSQDQEASKPRTSNAVITSYNSKGLSIFETSTPAVLPSEDRNGLTSHFAYATTSFPVDFTSQSDLNTYISLLSNPPEISVPGGTVLRILDFHPRCTTPMHRTLSLDYGVVIEGEIELVLDLGESRVLKKGDVVVQRGTNHLWRNNGKSEWARIMFVTQSAKLFVVNGKAPNFNQALER